MSENEFQPHAKQMDVELVDEMRKAYLDYSMSVIVGRALPDVRSGSSRFTAVFFTQCMKTADSRQCSP